MQVGAAEIRLVEIGPREVGPGKACAAKLRVVEIGFFQGGAREIGAGKIAPLEIDAGEIAAAACLTTA